MLDNILFIFPQQDTTEKFKDKYGVAKAHSSDLLTYIQEDSGILPRAAIITVAGLGGIVAGYRGESLSSTRNKLVRIN